MRQKPLNSLAVMALLAMFSLSAHAQMPSNVAPSDDESFAGKVTPNAEPRQQSAVESSPLIKSMFYTPEEMVSVRRAISLYKKYKVKSSSPEGEPPDILDVMKRGIGNSISPNDQQKKTYTYPQFFLQSVEYHSPTDWLIHINGRKIGPTTPPDALHIVSVEKNKVAFQWRPSDEDMGKIKTPQNQEPDDNVKFNSEAGVVAFTLQTNQTFSAFAMQVLEGKVLPVIVGAGENNNASNNASNNAVPAGLPAPPPPQQPDNQPPPSPPAGNEGAGLGGLLNAYKTLNKDNP